MGQNQPLPVQVQLVRGAGGAQHQAAAPGTRLHQQVDLRIVPQGLKVADALHRGRNGLPVADGPRTEGHLHAEPLLNEPLQNFQLDLAHELDVDFPGGLVPDDVELGVFLLQLPQPQQGRVGVCAVGQLHLIGQHRLQHRACPGLLKAQALPRYGPAEARHRHHRPGGSLLHGAELHAGIDAQLVRFFLPNLVLRQARTAVGQQVLHPQCAAGDFQIGQPGALAVPGDLEHPGAELGRIVRDGGVPLQPLQEIVHALQLQGGAEEAGEQLPGSDHGGDVIIGDLPGFQIPLQHFLVADGGLLRQLLRGRAEVHAAAVQAALQVRHQSGPVRAA